MVGLFVRLKLRLIRGNLHGDTVKQIGFAFTTLAALGCAVGGFALFALLRLAVPGVAGDLGIVAFTVFTIGWILVPLLAFGLDETLDPSRLALFPLTTRQMAAGLFAASVAGPWPLASLVALSGAVVGLASGPSGVLIGVPAVLLQFALCVVASRAVTTALSASLRSRRGRDVLAVAAVLVILLFQLPGMLASQGFSGDPRVLLDSAASVLRWAPPGMAAHAIEAGGLVGLGELVVVAAAVAVLGWLWIIALRRALVTPDSSNQSGGSVRRSRLGGLLPGGVIGAVVAKELKYARREPRGRISWFLAVVVTGVLTFSLRGPDGLTGPAFVIGPACLAATMIGIQAANSFGIDGRSLWMNAVAFSSERDVRTDFAGRQLAIAIIAVPLLLVLSVGASLVAGEPAWAVPAVLSAWGVLGVGLGVGAVTSVILPYTLPDRLNAFTGAAPGQGGEAFLGSLGAMLGTSMVALPVFVPLIFGATWASVLAVPYGLLAAWGGRRLGGMIGHNRLPEIVAAVSRPT
ncbi:hypothetical protein [Microtetraspora sp. NBRC 16547]|uniref:hypothetical protein n=1 Tax=Microtetraspora sp. NBRC 16547 TaxID=3030993 RepID=UPI0024A2D007|nr:hypothetical protein [Microtetraspora sp. NBRC 16547]GLW96118.1 transporter [Microtetraspora sp. NBRC 16547]